MPKNIKLDQFRYITSESWRALVAIEMGMKNHELVPIDLALKISRCKRSGASFAKLIRDTLVPNGLVGYENEVKKSKHGYRLTNLGYDYLALHQLFKSGQVIDLGSMIGVGKEADVYVAIAGDSCGKSQTIEGLDAASLPGTPVVIKFHRLGRTSFRRVKSKRDYHQHRQACSWLYLDRLASQREYDMMKVLYTHGLPVPIPLSHNRNAVLMSHIGDALTLYQVPPGIMRADGAAVARSLYKQALHMLNKICSIGLIHGDFNEFNLLVTGITADDTVSPDTVKLFLIDFPQMISREHRTAEELYLRDATGLVQFFGRFFFIPEKDEFPSQELREIKRTANVDVEVKAPGYIGKQGKRNLSRRHDTLLGSAARASRGCWLSSEEEDEDNSQPEEVFGSDSDSSSKGEITDTDSDGSNEDFESFVKPVDDASKLDCVDHTSDSIPMNAEKTEASQSSNGLINQTTIRERNRRERRQHEQAVFQKYVKQQNRAHFKRQGRLNLKSERNLFCEY